MEKITEKVDSSGQKANLPNTPPIERKYIEEKMSLEVKVVENHSEEGVIGGEHTVLAAKDEATYMIVTSWAGMKVMKKGAQVYSAKLPEDEAVLHAFYADHLDCFIFIIMNKIYRKDINSKPPYLHLETDLDFEEILNLKYSLINRSLIFLTMTDICILDLDAKRVVSKVEMIEEVGWLEGFTIFGEKENRLVTMSNEGDVSLLTFNFELRRLLALNRLKIDLNRENETLSSIAVSDLNDYLLFELVEEGENISRILIFEVVDNALTKKCEYFRLSRIEKLESSFHCFGQFQNHILWVGLGCKKSAKFHIFDFDVEEGKLRHLEEKGVESQTDCVFELIRFGFGRKFYYTSKGGRVLQLSVNL